jgi:hypothetical protein
LGKERMGEGESKTEEEMEIYAEILSQGCFLPI